MRSLRVLFVSVVSLLSLALLAPPAHAAPDAKLRREVAAVLKDPRVTRNQVGVVVRDAATGEYLYRRSSTASLTPASNLKLVTAGAAMSELGAGYRFHTDVYGARPNAAGRMSGNLYLKGYGDPTTLQADLARLARGVRAAGVRTVSGGLVADASWFDNQRYSPAWSSGYASDYYAAQISALTMAPNTDFDAGTVIIGYRPATKAGAKPVLSVTPRAAAPYVKLVNRATTAAGGSTSIAMHRVGNTITVSGRIATGRAAGREWITVNDPKLLAALVFRSELTKAGVKVSGKTASGVTPSGRARLARDYSMPLSQLLVPFLKLSNNAHAEALTKAMGREHSGRGTWSAGLARTRAWLKAQGAPTAGVRLVDGSGLARGNKLTAQALSTVLVSVRKASWFPSFYAALPIAGVNSHLGGGTLRNRMDGSAADNNAHAKTGTLTNVTSLSGYVSDRSGRRYVFVMISNYRGSTPRPVEDKLVVALAKHRR